jgi:hypothetical protein
MSLFPVIYLSNLPWSVEQPVEKDHADEIPQHWHLVHKNSLKTAKKLITTVCGCDFYIGVETSIQSVIHYIDTDKPQTFVNPDKLCSRCFNVHIRTQALRALMRKLYGTKTRGNQYRENTNNSSL